MLPPAIQRRGPGRGGLRAGGPLAAGHLPPRLLTIPAHVGSQGLQNPAPRLPAPRDASFAASRWRESVSSGETDQTEHLTLEKR